MSENNINKLMKQKVNFLTEIEDFDDDVAICSRIRLARNIANFKFPVAASSEELFNICQVVDEANKVSMALGENYLTFVPDKLSDVDREILFERRLASRDFLNREKGNLLLVGADELNSVMVNEEDHLRLQSLCPGFCLLDAWDRINKLDDLLNEKLEYSYDNKLGYLTSCPTNVGTGMRASVMLHLPGLVLSGRITPAIQGINKLSFAVRGIFGEGTENLGNLFQISNQSTLGENEQTIIERLAIAINQIIEHEKNARMLILKKDKYAVLDLIGRSYGILRHAYKLDFKETLKSLSAVRLGVDIGVFNHINVETVNTLLIECSPAHLQKNTQKDLDVEKLDIIRASHCRDKLRNME